MNVSFGLAGLVSLVALFAAFAPLSALSPAHRGVRQVAQVRPAGSGGASLAQSPGTVVTSTGGAVSVSLASTPPSGDMLVIFVVSATPIPVPTTFSTPAASYQGSPSPGPMQVFYGVVGRNGLTGATSYALGNGPMIAQMIDVTGENEQLAPSFSVDSPVPSASPTTTPTGQVGRTVSVLASQGLTLAAFGGNASSKYEWLATPSSMFLSPTFPGGVSATAFPQTITGIDSGSSAFGLAMAVYEVTSEAFAASPNPFAAIGQFGQRMSFSGSAAYDGLMLTILPAPSTLASPALATPPSGKFYISARYNELSGYNGTYDQPSVVAFEAAIGHVLTVNSHFHAFNEVFPWGPSTSNPYADYGSPLPTSSPYTTPYNAANTDEEDDAINGRYVLTTWNCGDTDWNVAHGNDDAQIIATAERMRAFGQPIFVRYFHEMNLDSTADGHGPCLDGLASPNPTPPGYLGSAANLSGDTTPNPLGTPATLGYFNPGEWKAAYMHVHDLVRSIAPNVNFVFVPSGGGMGDPLSFQPHLYYPGDRFVEWLGFDDYERRSYGTFSGFVSGNPQACETAGPTPGPTYYCPNTIYSEVIGSSGYTQVPWQSPSPKPVFVAETATQPTNQPVWLATSSPSLRSTIALTLSANYSQIAGLSYFDSPDLTNSWVLTGAPPPPTPTPPNGYTLFRILANDTNSAPGPSPSPSASPAATGFTISYGSIVTSTGSTISPTLSATPSVGDTLMLTLVSVSPIGSVDLPANWTALGSASNGKLEIAYCKVTATICSSRSGYYFDINAGGAMAQLLDINGAGSANPISSTDKPTIFSIGENAINEFVGNLQVTAKGGLTLAVWSGEAAAPVLNYPGTATPNPNGLYLAFPSSGILITSSINTQIGTTSNYTSLATYKISRETYNSLLPFTTSARYFNNIPSPGPTGSVYADGIVVWLPGS